VTTAIAPYAVHPFTQKILKNFSTIAGGQLFIQEGTTQKALGGAGGKGTKSVLAIAEIPDAWPKLTAFYDLNQFLGALSTFDKPVIQFVDDVSCILSNDGSSERKIRFRLSDPSTVINPATATLASDNPDIEFALSTARFGQLKKTASMLQLTHITLTVDGGAVIITGMDPKNPNGHTFEIEVPSSEVTAHSKKFSRSMRFDIGHFQLPLDGDYSVAAKDGWKYVYLTNKSAPVSYFIAEERVTE